ncbi:NADH dehydrogenase (ubiquinone) 1 alpha subcomplex subunit 4, partial [Phenoliferia sp. Uapishka_3]
MAYKFLTATKTSVVPYLVYVALGTTGAVTFATRYVMNHQDVVIRKDQSRDPWNQVHQGQNTKLFSWNQDFWQSRQTLPDPRAMFQQENGTKSDVAKIARARAVRKAKLAKDKFSYDSSIYDEPSTK